MIVRASGYAADMTFSKNQCEFYRARDANDVVYLYVTEKMLIAGVLFVYRSRFNEGELSAFGTMVRPAYRKKGIGSALWREMLRTENPSRMNVQVISNKGLTLINKMKAEFPNVCWDVDVSNTFGLPNLRDLRGKGRAA